MNKMPLYFDYMATTPVDPRVIEKMLHYLGKDGIFGNPASTTHRYGQQAQMAVETARAQIAESVHAEPREIVFTSGATEADNLAILGAARFYQRKGKHLITSVTEHKAVLDSFHQLEQEGFHVSYLTPQPDGLLSLQDLEQAITEETILVSIMHVNNEIGVVQDIAAIGELLKNRGIIFHVDAAQSAGKIAINLRELSVDLMSFSAHKNYGPKGIGALFVRQKPRIRLQPQSFGGGHEGGLRSGTLATHQIVGMGEAFALAEASREVEQERILKLRELLWNNIKVLPDIHLNGHTRQRVAGNLNITFPGVEGDSLLYALKDLAVSSTSACASSSMQPSYVLKAIGLDNESAFSSIRLSIGRFTTEAEIIEASQIIRQQVSRLHEISP
ncbi:cysteine desulfurase NifS [Legionella quinlivanii]|uniref:cysteine desulfurase n=1 Tax=Legionella quinlivanii TaxID=45073 RepID=A0A0W0XWR0_9GAMM|nr:IscS subfamily cysteine desulfurase [Legionella quinlivanii]KTD49131.1 cysteine desulfurase NifS [Legionella quinlivanii]MCW8450211.1 IscS subfamily cysteine desulfurase [Legionella quinlivanii]SEG43327.1 cysteine desulfurase IscS [Legionella quinlivanii DSM 21216]STY11641.1 cysteine desulfurase NifS [Legionella quinlivanii]